ncbi:MAG: tetratricopeptide repeat protein [Candidatus Krumholzibacteriota bacterium]|nr:tetratricopeptide repeat protein [Candidatus Krumholzibacteriota bacterium]
MRKSLFLVAAVLIVIGGLYGCKSVETTSAMLHNQTQSYDKAIKSAKLGLEKNPNDAEAYYQLGYSYSKKDSMRLAYENFTKAAELDPNKKKLVEDNIKSNWAGHYNNGLSEYQLGNLKGAVKEFDKATNADPRRLKSWLRLVTIAFTLSDEDSVYLEKSYEATDSLRLRLDKEHEDYTNALSIIGRIEADRGNIDRAAESFEALIDEDPTKVKSIEGTGEDFRAKGEWAKAAKFYEIAVDAYERSGEENYAVYHNLGLVYRKQKKFHKAIVAYESAHRVKPKDKMAAYSLLLTYYQAKLFDQAIMFGEEYTQKIAPGDPKGWQILSLAYKEKGFKIKAEETFRKYLEVQKNEG